MRRFGWLGFALVISMLFNVGFVAAFLLRPVLLPPPPVGEEGPDGAPFLRALKEKVGLSDEQIVAAREARRAMWEQVQQRRDAIRAEKERIADLVTATPADRDALAAAAQRVADLQRDIQLAVLNGLVSLRESVTPEQRGRLDELIQRRMCTNPMCGGGCGGGGLCPRLLEGAGPDAGPVPGGEEGCGCGRHGRGGVPGPPCGGGAGGAGGCGGDGLLFPPEPRAEGAAAPVK